jgi:hypothetical protein
MPEKPLYFTSSIKHTNNNFLYVPNDDLGSAFIGEFEYEVKHKFEVVDVGSDFFMSMILFPLLIHVQSFSS